MAVVLIQLPLGATPHCVSGGMATTNVTHEGMSMPAGGAGVTESAQCDSCEPGPQLPCDHGSQGACATMSSCATLAVEAQTASVVDAVRPVSVIESPITVLATLTASPDTPPPRA